MPRRGQALAAQPVRGQRRDHQSSDGSMLLPGIEPIGRGDWIRLGLYSYPGWGKTSIVGTSALAGRTLIIHSSLDLMPSRILRLGSLDHFVADTWEKMLEIQDYLRMGDHPYLWVWWDCVSIHQDVLLDDIWEGTVAAKPSRAFKVNDKGLSTGVPNLSPSSGLDKGEYGRNMERIGQWVRHMVGANSFHFGMTFHPFEGKHPTNDEGGTLLVPFVQGKNMTEKMCGYTNMLAFLEVMEGDDDTWRRFHVQENSRFYAKDQYDAFLPKGYIDITNTSPPTIPRIMAAVEAARGKPLGDGRISVSSAVGQPSSGPRRSGRRGRA